MKAFFLKKWKGINKNACLSVVDIVNMAHNGRMVEAAIVEKVSNDGSVKNVTVPLELVDIVPDPEVFDEGFIASSKVRN